MREPVNYVASAPCFEVRSRARRIRPSDCEFVEGAALGARHAKPIVAIGGITLETAMAVIDASAASVAVITDLLVGDPAKRARQYLSVLGT